MALAAIRAVILHYRPHCRAAVAFLTHSNMTKPPKQAQA